MMNTIGGAGFQKAIEDFQAFANRKNGLETSNRNAERIIAAVNKTDEEKPKNPNVGKQLDIKA